MTVERILITGATGFIGQYFVNELIKKHYQLRVLIRNTHHHTFDNKIDIRYGDLTQPDDLIGVCENIDTVFHLGGYAHAWEDRQANQHYTVNYLGTKYLLHEALRAKVKNFIYFSSVKAVADAEHVIDETWDELPDSAYGKAKRDAEKFVLAMGEQNHMHVTILRPALVYGPGWKGNLYQMTRAIDKGRFPPLPQISNKRSLIGVKDLCQAALLAANTPIANGKIYFVTDGHCYSTYQLYALILKALGKPQPKWHVPFGMLKIMAKIGDVIGNILRKRLPFNSDALIKLFGSAYYNSERIQSDLNFKACDNLESMLPLIINEYRRS